MQNMNRPFDKSRMAIPNGVGTFNPQTPVMGHADMPSPAQLTGQSPRTQMHGAGHSMQRNQSKGGAAATGAGAMLPPQSPANTMQRSATPKPKAGQTPKAGKDDAAMVSASRATTLCHC